MVNVSSRSMLGSRYSTVLMARSGRTWDVDPNWCRLSVCQLEQAKALQVTTPFDMKQRLSHGDPKRPILGT